MPFNALNYSPSRKRGGRELSSGEGRQLLRFLSQLYRLESVVLQFLTRLLSWGELVGQTESFCNRHCNLFGVRNDIFIGKSDYLPA